MHFVRRLSLATCVVSNVAKPCFIGVAIDWIMRLPDDLDEKLDAEIVKIEKKK